MTPLTNDACAYPGCRATAEMGLLGRALCARHWRNYAALDSAAAINAFRRKIGAPEMMALDTAQKTGTITIYEKSDV